MTHITLAAKTEWLNTSSLPYAESSAAKRLINMCRYIAEECEGMDE